MKVEEAAAILGISADADMELLKQTFRKLALVWHPDKVNSCEYYVMTLLKSKNSVMMRKLKKNFSKFQ